MKATGIVRRIDDLGRVVVPKEIRRTLHIREGDPLEIFTDHDGEIILKKYSPIHDLTTFAQQFCESASQILNTTICVSDCDQFIAASGADKKIFLSQRIHPELEDFIQDRGFTSTYNKGRFHPTLLASTESLHKKRAIATIICHGDAIGCVAVIGYDDEEALATAKIGAVFLGKQLE